MANKSLYAVLLVYLGLTVFCTVAHFSDRDNILFFQICWMITAVFRMILSVGMVILMFQLGKLCKLKQRLKRWKEV